MSDRVHIPFSEDIEERCAEKPEGAAWGWFKDHPEFDRDVVWLYCPDCRHSSGCPSTREGLVKLGSAAHRRQPFFWI